MEVNLLTKKRNWKTGQPKESAFVLVCVYGKGVRVSAIFCSPLPFGLSTLINQSLYEILTNTLII